LIFGCLTGIAAFFGVLLNVSFGLAGIAGVNPEMVVLGMLLILAWRNAGYIGLDRWVLPALGTPWQKGKVFDHPVAATPA
ncbi:MAG TPA: DoxX family protein, partial [Actinomycetota bacterium]|nr:DoxX family protein [Actinomycetota bacterium]